jgi:hypothetical protein
METQIRKLHPEIENLAALMDDRFKLFGFTFGLNWRHYNNLSGYLYFPFSDQV